MNSRNAIDSVNAPTLIRAYIKVSKEMVDNLILTAQANIMKHSGQKSAIVLQINRQQLLDTMQRKVLGQIFNLTGIKSKITMSQSQHQGILETLDTKRIADGISIELSTNKLRGIVITQPMENNEGHVLIYLED